MDKDYPERIWADVQVYQAGYVMGEWDEVPLDGVQEWVRADLYQSQAERIAELEEMVLKHVKLCDANELRAERDNLKAIIEKHIYDEGSYPND